MWGFDIRNWLEHLNPLTWPEVLRQFALSAGFGPQLKKDKVKRSSLPEMDEVHLIFFFLLLTVIVGKYKSG